MSYVLLRVFTGTNHQTAGQGSAARDFSIHATDDWDPIDVSDLALAFDSHRSRKTTTASDIQPSSRFQSVLVPDPEEITRQEQARFDEMLHAPIRVGSSSSSIETADRPFVTRSSTVSAESIKSLPSNSNRPVTAPMPTVVSSKIVPSNAKADSQAWPAPSFEHILPTLPSFLSPVFHVSRGDATISLSYHRSIIRQWWIPGRSSIPVVLAPIKLATDPPREHINPNAVDLSVLFRVPPTTARLGSETLRSLAQKCFASYPQQRDPRADDIATLVSIYKEGGLQGLQSHIANAEALSTTTLEHATVEAEAEATLPFATADDFDAMLLNDHLFLADSRVAATSPEKNDEAQTSRSTVTSGISPVVTTTTTSASPDTHNDVTTRPSPARRSRLSLAKSPPSIPPSSFVTATAAAAPIPSTTAVTTDPPIFGIRTNELSLNSDLHVAALFGTTNQVVDSEVKTSKLSLALRTSSYIGEDTRRAPLTASSVPISSADANSLSSPANPCRAQRVTPGDTTTVGRRSEHVAFSGEDIVCGSCKTDANESHLLLCDSCPRAWHTYCLRPPLPSVPTDDEPWYCPTCVRGRAAPAFDKDGFAIPTPQPARKRLKALRDAITTSSSSPALRPAQPLISTSDGGASVDEASSESPSDSGASSSPAGARVPAPVARRAVKKKAGAKGVNRFLDQEADEDEDEEERDSSADETDPRLRREAKRKHAAASDDDEEEEDDDEYDFNDSFVNDTEDETSGSSPHHHAALLHQARLKTYRPVIGTKPSTTVSMSTTGAAAAVSTTAVTAAKTGGIASFFTAVARPAGAASTSDRSRASMVDSAVAAEVEELVEILGSPSVARFLPPAELVKGYRQQLARDGADSEDDAFIVSDDDDMDEESSFTSSSEHGGLTSSSSPRPTKPAVRLRSNCCAASPPSKRHSFLGGRYATNACSGCIIFYMWYACAFRLGSRWPVSKRRDWPKWRNRRRHRTR